MKLLRRKLAKPHSYLQRCEDLGKCATGPICQNSALYCATCRSHVELSEIDAGPPYGECPQKGCRSLTARHGTLCPDCLKKCDAKVRSTIFAWQNACERCGKSHSSKVKTCSYVRRSRDGKLLRPEEIERVLRNIQSPHSYSKSDLLILVMDDAGREHDPDWKMELKEIRSENISAKTKLGLARAKSAGKRLGRPPKNK